MAVLCLTLSVYAAPAKILSKTPVKPTPDPFLAYYASILQDVAASYAPEDMVLPVANGTVTVKGPVFAISTTRGNGFLWGSKNVPNEKGILEASTGKFWYQNKATKYYESTTSPPKINAATALPLYVQYKNAPLTINAINSSSLAVRVTLNNYVVLSTPAGKELVTPYICPKTGKFDTAKEVYFNGSTVRDIYWYKSNCDGQYRQMERALVGWPK
ncbi:MAG: hypothetical protein V1492_05705 [Candidatus Micrarchaeota archaeon]